MYHCLLNPRSLFYNEKNKMKLKAINICFQLHVNSLPKKKKKKKIEKLHFTTLNYTSCYTLHHKFFEYTFCTINYDPYYTLHHDVKFAVNLDAKI